MSAVMPDKTLHYYINHSDSLISRYESADGSNIQSFLKDIFPVKVSLLEIGSGSGRDAAYMLNEGHDIIAIDGSDPLNRRAVEIHPELKGKLITFLLPGDLPFNDAGFDGCYAIAVLMHFYEAEIKNLLKEIYRVLKDYGTFVFSVPTSRNDVLENNRDKKGRLFILKTKEYWMTLLNNAGFDYIKESNTDDGLDREEIKWLTLAVRKIHL